jgi:hypothetical protein
MFAAAAIQRLHTPGQAQRRVVSKKKHQCNPGTNQTSNVTPKRKVYSHRVTETNLTESGCGKNQSPFPRAETFHLTQKAMSMLSRDFVRDSVIDGYGLGLPRGSDRNTNQESNKPTDPDVAEFVPWIVGWMNHGTKHQSNESAYDGANSRPKHWPDLAALYDQTNQTDT